MENFILFFSLCFLIVLIVGILVSFFMDKKRFEKQVDFLKKCAKKDSDEYINSLIKRYEK